MLGLLLPALQPARLCSGRCSHSFTGPRQGWFPFNNPAPGLPSAPADQDFAAVPLRILVWKRGKFRRDESSVRWLGNWPGHSLGAGGSMAPQLLGRRESAEPRGSIVRLVRVNIFIRSRQSHPQQLWGHHGVREGDGHSKQGSSAPEGPGGA